LPVEDGHSDSELVGLTLHGEDKAFEQLLTRHRQRILGICFRLLGDKIEAEEAAQESFVKIYFHLKEFDQTRDFAAWAASVSMNECRDRLRKRTRHSTRYREISEGDGVQEPEVLSDSNDYREQLSTVEEAIEKLPPKLKEVLVLKAYGEYGYEEIAQALKVKIGTVMSRLYRARQKLAELIGRGNLV
jgi:RNA polymerase sigma factor (sigma-70 family)